MNNKRVRFTKKDMRLDLGGIAKGFTLDVVGRELRRRGIVVFLLNLGGDLLLGDAPPNTVGWCVGDVSGCLNPQLDQTRLQFINCNFSHGETQVL